MLLRIAWRELARHPLRTSLAVAGVAVATAMLLDMLMLGGGLQQSFNELLRSRGYALRVTPAGTLPFDTGATLEPAGRLRETIAAEPGVSAVAPVLGANLVAAPDGPRLFVVGVDPEEQGLYRLVRGRQPAGSGEAVLGSGTAAALDLAVGDTVFLSVGEGVSTPGRSEAAFRIVGEAEFLYASRGERPAAVSLSDLQRLTRRPDRVSFFMVRVREDADPGAVARRLEGALEGADVASAEELVDRARERLSYFRQLAAILGVVSLLTTGLLVATIMAVSVSDRIGLVAAVRAIGVSRAHVMSAVVVESLLLCAVAAVVGLALGAVVGRYLETILSDFPGLPQAVRFFVLRPRDLVTAFTAVTVTGVVAALVPAWRATHAPLATTLHREEP